MGEGACVRAGVALLVFPASAGGVREWRLGWPGSCAVRVREEGGREGGLCVCSLFMTPGALAPAVGVVVVPLPPRLNRAEPDEERGTEVRRVDGRGVCMSAAGVYVFIHLFFLLVMLSLCLCVVSSASSLLTEASV